MTALIVIAVIIFLITLILFLPVNVILKFKDGFFVKIKLLGIKVFEFPSKKTLSKKSKKKIEKKELKDAQKADNELVSQGKELFSGLKEKYGFMGAVKKVLGLIFQMLTHIKVFLKHIKIKRIRLCLTVSGDNAADTAVNYGGACSVAYPVLAFLDSFSAVGFKEININSDFENGKKEFSFSLVIRLKIFYLLITAFKILKDYKNFTLKENCNERK